MADSMEEFLRRAAERRQARAKKESQQAAPPPPQASIQRIQTRSRSADAPPPLARPTRDRIDRIETRPQMRSKQQSPRPSLDSTPHLARSSSQADERMDAHLHETFEHQLGQFERAAKKPSAFATKSPRPGENTYSAPQVERENTSDSISNRVVAALRNPDSAKIAFIASEIFQRRF